MSRAYVFNIIIESSRSYKTKTFYESARITSSLPCHKGIHSTSNIYETLSYAHIIELSKGHRRRSELEPSTIVGSIPLVGKREQAGTDCGLRLHIPWVEQRRCNTCRTSSRDRNWGHHFGIHGEEERDCDYDGDYGGGGDDDDSCEEGVGSHRGAYDAWAFWVSSP